MNRKSLMAKLIASFREPIQPETIAVYLDELATFTDEELDFAITYWVREHRKFPSISDLRKACNERRSASKIWNSIGTARRLEDKSRVAPKFFNRLGIQDTPEAKAARIRFLNSKPTVLARYSDRDNSL